VERGYVGTDATLDHYKETYWFPKVLDRDGWHVFQAACGHTARERARDELLARLARYDYRPPQPAIAEVRRLFEDAWRTLGGDPSAPYLRMLYNE